MTYNVHYFCSTSYFLRNRRPPCSMARFILLILIVHLPLLIQCSLDCVYRNVTFSVCDIMFWTQWTVCNGVKCPLGQRQRFKSICCVRQSKLETTQVIKQRCMNTCNLTENDFKDHSPYVPPKGMCNVHKQELEIFNLIKLQIFLKHNVILKKN